MRERQGRPMTRSITELTELLAKRGSTLFFPGATEEEIAGLEKKLKTHLPPSFRAFLSETDGALLFQTEEIFGTKDTDEATQASILTVKEEQPSLPAHLIPFYRSNVSHFFDTSKPTPGQEYEVVTWNTNKQSYHPVALSFSTWLEALIEENE